MIGNRVSPEAIRRVPTEVARLGSEVQTEVRNMLEAMLVNPLAGNDQKEAAREALGELKAMIVSGRRG